LRVCEDEGFREGLEGGESISTLQEQAPSVPHCKPVRRHRQAKVPGEVPALSDWGNCDLLHAICASGVLSYQPEESPDFDCEFGSLIFNRTVFALPRSVLSLRRDK